MITVTETKLCQSCITRGFNPANPATREWQAGVFYCEDCFAALLQNLTNVAPAEVLDVVSQETPSNDKPKLPVLDLIYQTFNVPSELQFDKVDIVCRNHDKIFNFHAPAVVNKTVQELEFEVEQLAMSMFHIKYRMEPLEMHIRKLKEELRKEKNLNSISDSKEVYAKPKKSSQIKITQEEKMAKTLGMTVEEYRETVKQAQAKDKVVREQKFTDIITGKVVTK